MAMTSSKWQQFEETEGWREIVATVKSRMQLINQDLLAPEVCNSEAMRIQLQWEYRTCLWFINLTKIDEAAGKEKGDEKDRSVGPELTDFMR